MSAGKGTSLAALLLLVGAGAVLSGMVRSIATDPHQPPPRSSYFWLYFSRHPFPSEEVIFASIVSVGVVGGIAAGIEAAFRRARRVRGFFVGALGGAAMGGLAAAQVFSKGDLRMTLIGSLVLIVFGFVVRRATTPAIRTAGEIDWFRGAGTVDRPATDDRPATGESRHTLGGA